MTRKPLLNARRPRRVHWLLLPLLILGFLAWADNIGQPSGSSFSTALEYYRAPHEAQVKSLLRGDTAEVRGALVFVHNMRLLTFSEGGEVEMIVRAPQCVFDSEYKTVSSSNHLEAQSADGRWFFEGEGFLWQQTNNILFISNRVQTFIQNEARKPKPQ